MDSQPDSKRWLLAFLAAILLHLMIGVYVVSLLIPVSQPFERPPERERQETEITLQVEPEEDSDRQIVSVDQPPSETPDDAQFEDRYDRSVEEETVAR